MEMCYSVIRVEAGASGFFTSVRSVSVLCVLLVSVCAGSGSGTRHIECMCVAMTDRLTRVKWHAEDKTLRLYGMLIDGALVPGRVHSPPVNLGEVSADRRRAVAYRGMKRAHVGSHRRTARISPGPRARVRAEGRIASVDRLFRKPRTSHDRAISLLFGRATRVTTLPVNRKCRSYVAFIFTVRRRDRPAARLAAGARAIGEGRCGSR